MSNYDILTNKKKSKQQKDAPTKPIQPESDSSDEEDYRDGNDERDEDGREQKIFNEVQKQLQREQYKIVLQSMELYDLSVIE